MTVFAEFERELIQERVKAGVAASREKGKPHGIKLAEEVKDLYQNGRGLSKKAISRQLGIIRSLVGRILGG
jgi:putative DNA-invertase from lambdoid prophage Rac